MTTRAFLSMIQTLAGQRFGVSIQQIRGTSRKRPLTLARHVALWLGRALTGESYPELGRRTGGLDHSAVMYACRRVASLLGTDPALRETVLSLRDRLAMNIPEGIGVGRRMHLTFQPGPPRVTIEVLGEQAFEMPACLSVELVGARRIDGLPVFKDIARGTLWLAFPEPARAVWARIHGPVWHQLSFETAPGVFRNGRILLTATADPAPPEVIEQIGDDGIAIVSAAALVEWAETT
jgi:hypothetical protein